MLFINPLEILRLKQSPEKLSIDQERIRVAKQKLFTEMDQQQGGYLSYYGLELNKAECEQAIRKLSQAEHIPFYQMILDHKDLNEFLVNGNERLFREQVLPAEFRTYEFITFISPFFSVRFDQALLKAFEKPDPMRLKVLVNYLLLIAPGDLPFAYKSVFNLLRERVKRLSDVILEIRKEDHAYDEEYIDGLVDLVKEYFSVEAINGLPACFRNQVMQVADEINYLSVVIWSNFDNSHIAFELLEHVLKFNVCGSNTPTFLKNYELVKKKSLERKKEDKGMEPIKRCSDFIKQCKDKIILMENRTLTLNLFYRWMNTAISIRELNKLPKSFDGIKNQVGMCFAEMAVTVWNSYGNMELAQNLVNKAFRIQGLDSKSHDVITGTLNQLNKIKVQLEVERLALAKPVKKSWFEKHSVFLISAIWFLIAGILYVVYLASNGYIAMLMY